MDGWMDGLKRHWMIETGEASEDGWMDRLKRHWMIETDEASDDGWMDGSIETPLDD
jgi:hypothetical protein